MAFNIPNCSITSYSNLQSGTDNVADTTLDTYYTITISPDSGYQISYSDFSVVPGCQDTTSGINRWFETFNTCTDGLNVFPSEINYVEFTQNGNDVDVTFELDYGFAMNNQNQSLDVCIDGFASTLLPAMPFGSKIFSSQTPVNQNVSTSTNITQATTFLQSTGKGITYDMFDVEKNTINGVEFEDFKTPSIKGITYTQGDTIRIFEKTISTNNGYFSKAPEVLLKSSNKERYIISSNSRSDEMNRIISKTFTIDYKVPKNNVLPIKTGDKVVFDYSVTTKLNKYE